VLVAHSVHPVTLLTLPRLTEGTINSLVSTIIGGAEIRRQ
jgi:hypothetical protein